MKSAKTKQEKKQHLSQIKWRENDAKKSKNAPKVKGGIDEV